MIDKWLKNDLQNIYPSHSVDESGDAEFLLKTVEGEYTIQQANSEVEELRVKHLVEKAQPSHERFLIYTHSKKDDLKFIREYCETNGCLEIVKYLPFSRTRLSPESTPLTAAKRSRFSCWMPKARNSLTMQQLNRTRPGIWAG